MRKRRKKNILSITVFTLFLLVLICLAFIIGYNCGIKKSAKMHFEKKQSEIVEVDSKGDNENTNIRLSQKYIDIVDAQLKKINGNVQYGIHNYDENSLYISGVKQLKSASVIKIFIMEYAFNRIASGEISAETMISGETLENLINKMITISDNAATNKLIDYFSMKNLNDFFADNGYISTTIERKMLDTDAMKAGKDNYTSVEDVMSFLDKLYECQNESPYSEMLKVMMNQKVNTKIRKKFPNEIVIANKTGELSDVENDVGIIFSEKGDFAFVVLSNDVVNSGVARDSIATAAYELYNAF